MANVFNCSFSRVALRNAFRFEKSTASKFSLYNDNFKEYPNLQIEFKKFPKYSKVANNAFNKWRNGEDRRSYMKNFSSESWLNLTPSERKMHSLVSCFACLFAHSSDHAKFPLKDTKAEIVMLKGKLASFVELLSSIFDSLKLCGLKPAIIAKLVLATLDRSFHDAFKLSFQEALKSFTKRKANVVRANSRKENPNYPCRVRQRVLKEFKVFSETELNKRALPALLETKLSFDSQDRQVKALYFEDKRVAMQRTEKRKFLEATGMKKPKRNSPDPATIDFDKIGLLDHINRLFQAEENPKINFSHIAREFGITGPKGNMIVKDFLVSQGVDISKVCNPMLNKGKVRRQLLKFPGVKMSLPHPRGNEHLRKELARQLREENIELGEPIVPRTYQKITAAPEGPMVQQCTVLGRKISLQKIRAGILKKHKSNGWMRTPVGLDAEREEILTLGKTCHLPLDYSQTTEDLREQLIKYQTTRNLIVWIDHASLMNHGHLLMTVNVVYDPLIYLTEAESNAQIQQMVESPEVYIFGRSTDSILDKLSFVEERRKDLASLDEPVIDEITKIPYNDRMRFFHGDHPEQQFEAGQTVGGNFPCTNCTASAALFDYPVHCFRARHRTLQERREQVLIGNAKRVHQINPFLKMKKADLERECAIRGIYHEGNRFKDSFDGFHEHMAGLSRVPALCFEDEGFDFSTQPTASYEVAAVEPLHDLKEHIKNLWEELPCILLAEEKQLFQETMKAFRKDLMRGCDYRLSLVVVYKTLLKSCREPVLELLRSLAEISHIAYCSESKRSTQMVLRCHNQTFIHYCLCKELIQCKSISRRKFFGTYLHAITTEFPLFLRYISLQSLNTEDEERQFTTIKDISRRTSNRHPQHIIDNTMIRMQPRPYIEKQPKSKISILYESLPASRDTEFSYEHGTQEAFQAHCERIADYLSLGEGVWWERGESSIIFKDASLLSPIPENPRLSHFRSDTMESIKRNLEKSWQLCIQSEITLPLEIIRIYDVGKLSRKIQRNLRQQAIAIEGEQNDLIRTSA